MHLTVCSPPVSGFTSGDRRLSGKRECSAEKEMRESFFHRVFHYQRQAHTRHVVVYIAVELYMARSIADAFMNLFYRRGVNLSLMKI